jgi:hypothetical protein
MRPLSRLIVALVLCLISIALPAAPAQAQCGIFIELSPEYGLPGTNVTVSGHGFAAGVLMDIYYDGTTEDHRIDTLTTGSNGDFTIVITIPEGCQGHHEVSARGKYASADTYFTVEPGLTMTPENGPVGTTVAVEGKGFAKNEDGIELLYYYLNGSYETVESDITANSKGSWQTSFQVPLSTRGKHKIDADGAETKLYQVKDATFTVTAQISLDASSGFVGDPLTMTGSRFAAHEKGIQVLFDGQVVATDIKADSEGEWEASFVVPEMPRGEHSVTAQGEHTSKEDVGDFSFKIEPDIVLSPARGHVGTNVTVAGHGFAAGEELMITYGDIQVATFAASDKGSFDVSFPVPESSHGEHKVTVGTAGENHANAMFTMESDPPATPTPVEPASGSRLGLMGNVAPTFQWSGVSDDSGVRYSLQIAASDTVTDTGEFADPMVSVPDLVGTNYTLDQTGALSQGTYYWIVQAVDDAGNEGHWSTAHSFRVGLLPRWAFIAIIVAVALVIGGLILALIRRRGIYYDRW